MGPIYQLDWYLRLLLTTIFANITYPTQILHIYKITLIEKNIASSQPLCHYIEFKPFNYSD